MATVAEARGDLTGALRLHTRALEIKRRAAPADRPSQSVADSHYNMALLLARLARLPEARAAAQQSLALTRALAGPGHPHTLEAAALVRQLAPGSGPVDSDR
jgi:tetratricopeptide (TPR) repeat protein